MRQLDGRRRRSTVSWGLAGLAAAVLFALVSCTPGSEITAQESDVVATFYDSNVDFGSIGTYAMPDSIVPLGDPDDTLDKTDTQYDDEILSLIAENLAARGFTRVDEGSPIPPDILVLVGVTTSSYWYYNDFYPWYPAWDWYSGWGWWGYWGPGWGGYYPPHGDEAYAYSTGTLLVVIADPNGSNMENKAIPVYWLGAVNGMLNDTTANLKKRVGDSIHQMFEQSPYLRSGS
jgi:hypothetical protein